MKENHLIINSNPKSVFSESIKSIRTNLKFASVSKKLKIILITSPEEGDGKSFIASNLAVAFAQEGKKVLVIDCDLRKGVQHEMFGVMNYIGGGYSNLILNYNKPEDKEIKSEKELKDYRFGLLKKYAVKTSINNVDVLTTGPVPPNPVELLGSPSNKEIMEDIKKLYDVIILDCPPVIGLADTLLMTAYSDANLLVVSAKKTKEESIRLAKKAFENANAKITGVIFNKADFKNSGYYSKYYTSSYYTK